MRSLGIRCYIDNVGHIEMRMQIDKLRKDQSVSAGNLRVLDQTSSFSITLTFFLSLMIRSTAARRSELMF